MSGNQLSLVVTGEDVLERISQDAVERGLHPDCVDRGIRAVRSRFAGELKAETTPAVESRIHAYFAGALRRSVMRSRGESLREMRRRAILRTLAEDLARSGATFDRIVSEIEGVYGTEVPMRSIDEIASEVCRYARVS